MKICTSCKSDDPKYFFRCYIGNKTFEKALCEDCMQKEGEAPLALIGKELIFEESAVGQFTPEQMGAIAELECKCCGTTHAEVSKYGWFGCEECYVTFSDLLNMADAQIEREIKRKLDMKEGINDASGPGKIQILERQMDRAVEDEDYERAAELRDEISRLKGGTDQDE